jgi:catechol 2,3-dioxygenase-like lactoylglutathione lyase family enzyme
MSTPRPQGAAAGDCCALGIHHVGITVAQLERSLVFYRDLLGFRVVGISDDEDIGAIVGIPGARARIADLDAGNGQILELAEYDPVSRREPGPGPNTAGSCHLSFQVGNLRSALSHLAAAGVAPIGETVPLEGGGVWHGCTIVYLRDPDQVTIELIELPSTEDHAVRRSRNDVSGIHAADGPFRG